MEEWSDFGGMPSQGTGSQRIWLALLVHIPALNSKTMLTSFRHIHRADLHRGLLTAAIELGCTVHLDSRVVSIDAYSPSLVTKNGETFEGDLIVASDGRLSACRQAENEILTDLGLHSMAREIVMGQPGPPIPTGQMVYRVTLPTKTLKGIPELEEIITVPRNNHWLGPDGTVLSYLLEGVNDTLINFVFT
jgi:salicylate hydroxylase